MATNQNQVENLEITQEQSDRFGIRRNALTPESHNIDPIKQTEIQEKLSNLSMASTSESSSGEPGPSTSGHNQSGT